MKKAWWVLVWLLFWGAVTPSPGLSPEYQEIIERNLFSPERTYTPYRPQEKKQNVKEEEIKKNIILRGIYRQEEETYVILEVKSSLRKKWELDEKKRTFRVGEKLGPCQIAKVEKGEVLLEGCGDIKLSFADSPERKKPLPLTPRATSPQPSSKTSREATTSKSSKTQKNPFKVFFQKNKKQKKAR